jgi:hypothetical protein
VTDPVRQLQPSMIKKFQRSSADHELLIPPLIRTPYILLKTVSYIEETIADIDKPSSDLYSYFMSNRASEEENLSLTVYLFIWDRFRMIAKDFILQSTMLTRDILWVETIERMARWHVLMDHRMRSCKDFVSGHAQQNLEGLNNMLKTLDGYYRNQALLALPEAARLVRNQPEFTSYYLLVQLANTGVVTKYLQTLPTFVLKSQHVKLAISARAAFASENYVEYFRLLVEEANPLQAGLMVTYVAAMRTKALRVLSSCTQKGTYYPLSKLVETLKFEDGFEEVQDFLGQRCL